MTQEVIDVGTSGLSGSGDSLYEAGNKINANFTELYARPSVASSISMAGNKISSTDSNADIKLEASGTGAVVFPAIKFNGNNIEATRTNDDLRIVPSGTGAVSVAGLKVSGNKISSINSNDDIVISPPGTGAVDFGTFKINGNNIEGQRSNENIKLIPSGSGKVKIASLGFGGTTISSDDSSSLNINEGLIVDGTLSASGSATFAAVDGGGSFVVSGLTTVSSLTTTGNMNAVGTVTLDNLTFNDNIISSNSNADINLTPGGTGVVNISNLTIDSTINLADNVIQVTTSNADIELQGSGTGSVNLSKVNIDGGSIDNTVIGAGTPAAGTFTTLTFDPAASGSLSTTGVTITDNSITASLSNDNLELTGNGSGAVSINGFTLPGSDGSTGQILRTDGSKALTFVTSPILLGVTDIQDGTAEFTFKSETTVDHVVTTGGHELLDSTQRPIHTFTSSKYDSIWYHSVTRDDASDELSTNLYSVVHGTSSDSSIEAFVSESHITKTGTNNQLAVDADVLNGTVRLLGTGFNPTCSMSFYAVGLGDDDSSGYTGEPNASLAKITLGVAEKTTIDHVTESGLNVNIPNSEAQLTTFDKTQFDSAWFLGVTKDITNSKFATLKISAVHNNDSVYVSQSSITRSSTSHTFIPTITGDIESATDLVAINGTGSSAANSLAYYRIGLGDNDSTGYSGEEEVGVVINTDVDSGSETFDSWAHGSYRGAKYYISVNNDAKIELTNMEVLVVHDGSDAYVTVYNIVNTKDITDNILDVTAAISGSNVVVSMQGFDTNLRVHAYRILLGDAEADRTGTNVNVIGDVDVGNYTVTAVDHVTAVIDNTEDFSSETTFDTWSSSNFDSAWYHVIVKDETNDAFAFHKYSVCHGTSSDSSAEAFITDSGEVRSETVPIVTANADVNNGNVRVRLTAHNDGSSAISVGGTAYRIALGDNDSTGYSGEDEAGIVINTDVDSASETFDSWAHASYRGAKYYISINNDSKTEVANIEALVVHDGSDAFITTYNEHGTGDNPLATFTAAIVGSNVVVSCAGLETNLRITAYRILLADDEADRTGTNVNVIGEVTVSSSATLLDSFNTDTYQGAHYIIVGTKSNDSCIMEATVISNGSEAFVSEGPQVSTEETPMVNLTVNQVSSTAVLQAASTTGSSTTLNAYRIHIARPTLSTTDVVDTFASATYDGAHYIVVAKNGSDQSQIAEVTVVTDGSSAFHSVGPTVSTHSSTQQLLEFTSDYASSNARLLASNTQAGTNSKVNAYRVHLKAPADTVQTVDSFAKANARGAKYYVSINDLGNNRVENVQILVVHNGTNAFINVYGNTNTHTSDLATFSVDIDSSNNVRLRAVGTSSNTRIHAYRILLADDETDSSSTNINVIGEVTVSSGATFLDSFDTGSQQGAFYIIVATKNNDSAILEATVVSDGTDAYVSQGPQVSTEETPLISLTASHASTTTTVNAAATTGASTTVNAYRINIARGASSASQQTTLNEFDASTFRSAAYVMQITDTETPNYELFEARVTHDGSDAYISKFGRIGNTSTELAAITADISGGNVRLRGQITNTNTTQVKFVRRIMKV